MKNRVSGVVWLVLVVLVVSVGWKFIGQSSRKESSSGNSSVESAGSAAAQAPQMTNEEIFETLPGNDHAQARRWEGSWGASLEKPYGQMVGVVWPDDEQPGVWHAAFAPQSRGKWLAQVSMDGKEEGEDIVFSGEAYFNKVEDYTWSGRMTADTFTGKYFLKSNNAPGEFHMTPVKLSPGSTPESSPGS